MANALRVGEHLKARLGVTGTRVERPRKAAVELAEARRRDVVSKEPASNRRPARA
jgi:hypothetical protein